MKIIHLSDLHIGKRINEYSMLEEQEHILNQIFAIVDKEKPAAVLLAGDIYDKSVPSAEAVQLFDAFLSELASRHLHTFVISGNHDSAERIAFGSRIMDKSGIHLSPVYDGNVRPIILNDAYGEVAFYMLPFVKPAVVRHYFENETIENYSDAVRVAIEQMQIDPNRCNVLMAHQFVTGAQQSESEDLSVGGLDNVDASVFKDFDYVALGHLHRPQDCGDNIRYCGSPLKYSFSEVGDEKSVTILEIKEKGNIIRRFEPLKPLHDWQDLKGTYEELTDRNFYVGTSYQEDYVRITLTDENDVVDAIGKLRTIYHNLMELRYDNVRTRSNVEVGSAQNVERKSPFELFSELFEKQNGQPMTEEQQQYVNQLITTIWKN